LAIGDADPYALADDAFFPLEVAGSWGGGTRPPAGSALDVTGAEVSSLTRHDGCTEVRVFNPTDHVAMVTVAGRTGWTVDLRGRPVAPFEGTLELRPFGIGTVRLVD
jgi:hypothetical protein